MSALSDQELFAAYVSGQAKNSDWSFQDGLRAVAAAAVQAAREGQDPFIWAAESMEEKQLIDGRPRRVFWECVNGVGIPLYTAPPAAPAVPEGIDEALRALAKAHGWNFVWSRAKALSDGTQHCHKCHGGGLTHSSRCIHLNADAERAALRAAYPEHYAAPAPSQEPTT